MAIDSASTNSRRVLLFSGHMIDAPDRKQPRFPADKQPLAARAIADALQRLGAGPADLAVCSGACGGDLLFAEAALALGTALEIYLPFDVPRFLRTSVAFADKGSWVPRFHAAVALATLHVMPDELGSATQGQDPFERLNLWMLDAAKHHGQENIEFICLWNRQGGDGPGGTKHLADAVQHEGGRVHILDTNQLWPPPAP